MTDYVAEAITEHWGERCPDFAEGCPCCEAWAQYDRDRQSMAPEQPTFAEQAAEPDCKHGGKHGPWTYTYMGASCDTCGYFTED